MLCCSVFGCSAVLLFWFCVVLNFFFWLFCCAFSTILLYPKLSFLFHIPRFPSRTLRHQLCNVACVKQKSVIFVLQFSVCALVALASSQRLFFRHSKIAAIKFYWRLLLLVEVRWKTFPLEGNRKGRGSASSFSYFSGGGKTHLKQQLCCMA